MTVEPLLLEKFQRFHVASIKQKRANPVDPIGAAGTKNAIANCPICWLFLLSSGLYCIHVDFITSTSGPACSIDYLHHPIGAGGVTISNSNAELHNLLLPYGWDKAVGPMN